MADKETDRVIYTSDERGCCYNWLRILWCGCCEDSHKVTEKYVRINRWEGCSTVTDSMAMEAISDVTRTQSCCCFLSSCICGCCIHDFGNIKLYGGDETNRDGLLLHNVAYSKQVSTKLTRHLQQIHETFRKTAKFGNTIAKARENNS